MKASPPTEDYFIEMAPDDFAIVYDKIKMWKIAPWIIRGGLIVMMVIAYLFVLGNRREGAELDLIPTIALGLFFALAWGLSEWGMHSFMKRIKTDLQAKQKRVVQGELADCYTISRRNDNTLHGAWVIGEETFRMASAEYGLARKGNIVRLEILPKSKVKIKVEVLDNSTSLD